MLQNPEEKINALTKLADLIGKKPLVIWAIFTTFTTGYLFIDGRDTERELNKLVLKEVKEGQAKLIEEVKGIKKTANESKNKIDSTIPKLDTTLNNVQQTIKQLKKSK